MNNLENLTLSYFFVTVNHSLLKGQVYKEEARDQAPRPSGNLSKGKGANS